MSAPPLSPASDTVLRLEGVALGYGDFVVLHDFSMQVRRGQVVAIMGGSGSGKTTVLRAATGQIRPHSGTILAFGQDLTRLDAGSLLALRQRMGVLFQQGALFTDLDVYENVAFPLREHLRLSEAEIRTRVLDKLDAVGLRAAAHLRVSEVSGGMARRVALARAIALDPMLIMYDEPFAGLDPISLGVIGQLIRTLNDALGATSILVTHDIMESLKIVDYVYFVSEGVIVAEGTADEIRASQMPFVHQFVNGEPDGPVPFQYPAPDYSADLRGNGHA